MENENNCFEEYWTLKIIPEKKKKFSFIIKIDSII